MALFSEFQFCPSPYNVINSHYYQPFPTRLPEGLFVFVCQFGFLNLVPRNSDSYRSMGTTVLDISEAFDRDFYSRLLANIMKWEV